MHLYVHKHVLGNVNLYARMYVYMYVYINLPGHFYFRAPSFPCSMCRLHTCTYVYMYVSLESACLHVCILYVYAFVCLHMCLPCSTYILHTCTYLSMYISLESACLHLSIYLCMYPWSLHTCTNVYATMTQ
jgi:hypothetical protein